MSALPRDVPRLATIVKHLQLQLAEAEQALAAARERDAATLAAARQPGNLLFRLEPMRDPHGGAPALLHLATCPLDRGTMEASPEMATQILSLQEFQLCQVCDPGPLIPRP